MPRRQSQRRITRSGQGVHAQRLLALALLGLVLFDFPVLTLWVTQPIALFLVWGAFIAGLAWLLETAGKEQAGTAGESGHD